MLNNTLELSIGHLYPYLLNGDTGNVEVLIKRCEIRNIKIKYNKLNSYTEINSAKCDFYYIGSGQDKQQIEVAKELQHSKNILHQRADENCVILGIDSGYQLLGEYYQLPNGEKYLGAGLLDIYTLPDKSRFTGNVTVQTQIPYLYKNQIPENAENAFMKLVGFENHSGRTYIEKDTVPLSDIIIGKGNNEKDNSEGARKNNVIGTYLHGPLLPRNIVFADYLIKTALDNKYNDNINVELTNNTDNLEKKLHESLIGLQY